MRVGRFDVGTQPFRRLRPMSCTDEFLKPVWDMTQEYRDKADD
ncbi:hypothetical protein [Streptomyces sp. TP-A0356]|nr:hypothetical protein [Streptomyces sp. TP-A0356]